MAMGRMDLSDIIMTEQEKKELVISRMRGRAERAFNISRRTQEGGWKII